MENLLQGLVRQYNNGISLKIISKLFGGDQECIDELLDYILYRSLVFLPWTRLISADNAYNKIDVWSSAKRSIHEASHY